MLIAEATTMLESPSTPSTKASSIASTVGGAEDLLGVLVALGFTEEDARDATVVCKSLADAVEYLATQDRLFTADGSLSSEMNRKAEQRLRQP